MDKEPQDQPAPNLYKIVLIGDAGVGKTHITNRYIRKGPPIRNISTIGVEFATIAVDLKNGGKIKAQIWDTAGQEKYRAITAAHYRKAVGALLVYDITNSKTFENIEKWLDELRESCDEEIVVMLLGNKLDIIETEPQRRKIPREEASYFAQNNNLLFKEVSALNTSQIEDAFERLIETIYQQKQQVLKPDELSDLNISFLPTTNRNALLLKSQNGNLNQLLQEETDRKEQEQENSCGCNV